MSPVDDARRWLDEDPDERMRVELAELLARAEAGDDGAEAELADAFRGPLTFGTAGLRGRIGPGPHRMNSTVVARASAGLGRYVNEHGGGAVVIGFDARRDSDLFARTAAEILTGAGLTVLVLPAPLPTPVLAFAVRHLGCAAGVMITASHNPAADNGYKVYLADGSQIVSPVDEEISAHIADITAQGPASVLPRGEEWVTLGDDLLDAYVAKCAALVEEGPPLHVRIAYTPLHGVGGEVFLRTLEAAGFPEPVVVPAQFAPDGDFPTVQFPNPEEPGAMDLALALARDHDCDVLIAHDPDADRCAVGIPTAAGWRMLSGDQVGWLLGWWIAAGNRRLERDGVFAQSIVSGSMLEGIARESGLGYVQTLTGFKWIGRVPRLMFGYEEALGYCVDPNGVGDKDGISAAVMIAEMVARLTHWSSSPEQVLDDLAARFGVHATRQVSLRVTDMSSIDAIMTRLRDNPPATVADRPVTTFTDLMAGTQELPATDGLMFHLATGSRIIIRPSGTEPKVKCYLQSVVPVTDSVSEAQATAESELDAIAPAVERWLQ